MARQALFAELVYDEQGYAVETAVIGGEAQYVVDDNGFHRHIDAEQVDRQVLSFFLQQLEANKEIAVEQMLNMIGKDDLFYQSRYRRPATQHRHGPDYCSGYSPSGPQHAGHVWSAYYY
jgi:hypothetical protein